MKKLISLGLGVFVALVLTAAEVPVNGNAALAGAVNNAADGDILVLSQGNYTTAFNFPSGKTITLRAASGADVTLNFQLGTNLNYTGGGLIFEDLTILRTGGTIINGELGDVSTLTFRNCYIRSSGRNFVRTTANSKGKTIDEIVFENCIIEGDANADWRFLWPCHTVQKVSVTNSTLFNYYGEDFFWPDHDNGSTKLEFLFENNTVYKWSKSSSYALCTTDSKYGANSTYTFRNNLINLSSVSGQMPMIVKTNSGIIKGENNLIVNYGSYGNGSSKTVNDLTLAGLGLTTIGFPDPDHGDFTILSTSPLATAGKDGACVGDPRWIKVMEDVVTLTTALSQVGAGTVSPISAPYERNSTATVAATHNYGYRFHAWQNESGQTVSTDNPYTFNITEDTKLTAIYAVVPTYKLTVNSDGDGGLWGRFKLTPEPTNGVYEEGTDVTVSIVPNDVSTFLYWDDQTSDVNKHVVMDDNKTVTATFDWIPFLVAWNFDPSEPRGARVGDFYSRTDNQGLMNFYNADGSGTNWGGSTKSWQGITYTCARRYTGYADMSNPRYFRAEFSAKGKEQTQYSNVRISSFIASDNDCVHKIQKMQYATNAAGPYTDLKTIDLTPYHNQQWVECSALLPEEATTADKVYIRWIGDTTSGLLGTPNSNDTEGFYLANVVVYADIVESEDPVAPALLSTIPAANSSTASGNGNIVLTFDKRVKAGTNDGKIVFNGETLTPVFSNKTVTYTYQRLAYGTEYTVNIPAGTITNMSDVAYAGSQFTFTTMTRPQPTARLFNAVVDIDGTGDYTKVQDAINAAPTNRSTPWLIFIKNGYYEELLRIPSNKPYIHLIGEDKEQVVLTWGIHCGDPVSGWPNTSQAAQGVSDACASFVIDAANFYAENISFENKFGVEAQAGPQALAIKNNKDRFAVYNCNFNSFQDTWQTSSGSNDRIYAYKCWIAGAVDYFYNSGNAFVENSTLYNVRRGSVIVAPSHTADTKYGYVFMNCTVDGNAAAADGNQKLGRPWHNSPKVAYINTTMKIPIHPEGWTDMGAVPAYFAEFNSMDKNGNPIDLSSRKSCYNSNNTQVCGVKTTFTAEEAAAFTYEAIINSSDNWNPRAFFESVSKPTNIQTVNNTISWDASDYAICYAVYKNNRVVGFTTGTSYEDVSATESDTYHIRPVNEYGSLGEMSDPTKLDGSFNSNVQVEEQHIVIEQTESEVILKNLTENTRIRLYNLYGQVIQTIYANNTETSISTQGLRGMYLIEINKNTYKLIF